jgi:hypothetical protein
MGGERRASALPRRVLALVVSSGRARGARISGRRARRGVMCAVRGAARSRPAGSEVTVTAASGGFRAGEPPAQQSARLYADGNGHVRRVGVAGHPLPGSRRPAACHRVCCHCPCAASRSCAARAHGVHAAGGLIVSRRQYRLVLRVNPPVAGGLTGLLVDREPPFVVLADRALGAADRRRAGRRATSTSFGRPRMNRWGRRPSVSRRR